MVTNKLLILFILSIIIGLSSACSEPDGTPIYFQSDRDGQWEIYSIWHDGTNLQRLTEDQASDANPSLSLDGTKLAWIKTIDGATDIYTMNPDGTGAQNLSNGGIPGVIDYVTWSFKANLLILSVADPQVADGNHQIYSINAADGSSYTRLTKDDSLKHLHPRVNMQGLGYIVSAGTSDDSMDLLLINLEGKALRNIPSETFRKSANFQEAGSSEDHATFQPTGRAVMFGTNIDGNWEIYRVEPDGRKPGNITNQPDSNQTHPNWGGALDGVTFAYVSDQDGNPEIYTYSSDRGVPTRVTVNDATDTNPTWIKLVQE